VSAGTVVGENRPVRLYTQVAYQYATDYDQDRRDFMETPQSMSVAPTDRPRFEEFGTNPLFHEYGNTLFYGAGFAIPLIVEEQREDSMAMDLFSEFMFYHSFEEEDYIPMFEDDPSRNVYDQELDVVQDGGVAHVGAKVGFDNGLALTAGWGAVLFAKEPMYESPHWRAFAGLTYNPPEKISRTELITEQPQPIGPGDLSGSSTPIQIKKPPVEPPRLDCSQELLTIHFDFDRSNLTPEAMARLDAIGKYMRLCTNAKLEVQGHTDWIGTENYNFGLGNRRARAAVYYLVYDEGIDPARIVSSEKLAKGIIAGESYGETKPLQSNETDAGRAINRRAQFVKLTY
jgi:outer membrane protein OmpA-like peptidoglycan-associated protein